MDSSRSVCGVVKISESRKEIKRHDVEVGEAVKNRRKNLLWLNKRAKD